MEYNGDSIHIVRNLGNAKMITITKLCKKQGIEVGDAVIVTIRKLEVKDE